MSLPVSDNPNEPVDYENLVSAFNQALLHTLRKHSIADSFLDFWVPDEDPLLGIVGMIDSARIAGRSEIAVRFTHETVPATRLPELEKAVGRFGKVKIEKDGNHLLLRATSMSHRAEAATSPVRHVEPGYWTAADFASDAPSRNPIPAHWESTELPLFGDAHPRFRSALEATLAHPKREGEPGLEIEGLIRLVGRENGVSLVLDVDAQSQIVRRARHNGATKPSERAALDLFCVAAEGLPLQEVSDHVGLKVIDSLVDDDKSPPVEGVLLPANAGAPFELAPRLARQAYSAYRAQTGVKAEINFYNPAPSATWQMMSVVERRTLVERGLGGFLQSEGLYPDDMIMIRLEKTKTGHEIRAVIAFSDRIKVDAKPLLLRKLEQRLRRDVERQIELIADRAKDSSPLRRLL